MKKYQNEIDALNQKETEIKKNIINAIKDFMKEHQIKKFKHWFDEDDAETVSDSMFDEFNELINSVEDEMYQDLFEFVGRHGYAYYAAPNWVYVDEDGQLKVEWIFVEDGDTLTYNEDELIDCDCIPSLKRLIPNMQDERFRRMNEMISES